MPSRPPGISACSDDRAGFLDNEALRRVREQHGHEEWSTVIADASGNKVAFLTEATNLIAGDANRQRDVAVWTRSTGAITQANVTNAGKQANGSSWWRPSVSNDGTRIAFFSDATNLNNPRGAETVRVRDTSAGKTHLMATCSTEDPSTSCSFDAALSPSGNGDRLAYSMRRQAATSFVEDWRIVAVTSGRVQHSGHAADIPVEGLALDRDGAAYAVALAGLHVHNALGARDDPALGGWTAMSADGFRLAASAPNGGGTYLWDTTAGSMTQVDVP